MDDNAFRQQVVSRLNVIAQLLLEREQDHASPSFTKMAEKLNAMGLGPAEIGSVLGKPRNHITSALNKVKKSKKRDNQ